MKLTYVSADSWVYPEPTPASAANERAVTYAARNSYASFQLLVEGIPVENDWSAADSAVTGAETVAEMKKLALPASVALGGALAGRKAELYELISVDVDENIGFTPENRAPHYPSHEAPFRVYDCMRPFDGGVSPRGGFAAFYIALPVGADDVPGEYEGSVSVTLCGETLTLPLELTVYPAVVPAEETIKHVEWYGLKALCREAGSDSESEMLEKLVPAMRRMRQNMASLGGVKAEKVGEYEYKFDFSGLKRELDYFRGHGFTCFGLPSIGGRKSWQASDILVGQFGYEAMSYDAYMYLSQYLPELTEFVEREGLAGKCYMALADEPNDANAVEYRALSGIVRRFIRGISLMEPTSFVPIYGATDVYVAVNAEYQRHRDGFERLREPGGDLWHYVCCQPRADGFTNRYMDYELLSTRYLFWGNYKYSLGGYLHWAVSSYMPNQNPYNENTPEHHNADTMCFLPAGDTHLVYPGQREVWLSVRLEEHRRGLEDCELLKLLAKKDKVKADAICAKVFRAFDDVEYDAAVFESAERELLAAF